MPRMLSDALESLLMPPDAFGSLRIPRMPSGVLLEAIFEADEPAELASDSEDVVMLLQVRWVLMASDGF